LISILALVLALTLEERRELEGAIESHLAGDLTAAEAGYRAVLEQHPDFVPAQTYLAEALWLEGKRDEAQRTLERVTKHHPELLLDKWLRWRFGDDLGADEALLRRLESVYPFERQRFIATGTATLILLSIGETELAIEDFRRASALDPDDVRTHRQLGLAFAKARLTLPAAEAIERVVAVETEDRGSWKQLGSSYLVLQRWQSAIDAFEKAIELGGDDVGALLAQGYAFERLTNFDEALARYRLSSRLAPSSYQPQFRMGRAFLVQHDLGRAEKALKKASELDPSAPRPLVFLGELYLKKTDFEKAIVSLEKAVVLDADYFEAYYHLAQAYRRAGRMAEARTAIETYERLKRKER
jgi:tetratricopeptide (TPR) repeat protein